MAYRKYAYPALLSLLIIPVLVFTCSNQDENGNGNPSPHPDSLFSSPMSMGVVQNPAIDEASGLACSRVNRGMLWTHNDSGDKARIFLLTDSGKHVGEFHLRGAVARDIEDMAVGPGPEEGKSYIYLGDIGDNWAGHNIKLIYRFEEPDVSGRDLPVKDTIRQYDVIRLRYPDMNRDAETLMVDPLTRDIYIVSKREPNVTAYRAPYPHDTENVTIMEKVGEMPLTMIVSGDISPDGREILLKSYNEAYYWKLSEGESVKDILNREPKLLPLAIEPQGEAIAWEADGLGYYTLSEEVFFIQAVLYYYQRK